MPSVPVPAEPLIRDWKNTASRNTFRDCDNHRKLSLWVHNLKLLTCNYAGWDLHVKDRLSDDRGRHDLWLAIAVLRRSEWLCV